MGEVSLPKKDRNDFSEYFLIEYHMLKNKLFAILLKNLAQIKVD
jgi:hypothetical protein